MIRTIQPPKTIQGTIQIPGDKSISHRALIMGAMAEGITTITNLLPSEDVKSTQKCLERLGVRFSKEGERLHVHGKGKMPFSYPEQVLDAGNSGTGMRLLSGVLATQPFTSELTGDDSLRSRPMKRIIDPLEQMGGNISAVDGKAPLRIQGKRLSPIHYKSPVASAQIKSCVLLAGLNIEGRTSVEEVSLSRDHTERMLPCFGVPVEREGLTVSVEGPANLTATEIDVPGDISSAAFFLAAGAMLEGSSIRLLNVGINPTRIGILETLQKMGASIRIENSRILNGEPRGDLVVHKSHLKSIRIEKEMIPKLIDELPILAVIATQAEGMTEVRDAQELRVKESDRIHAVTTNLRCMGIQLEERDDGFVIPGPQTLKGAVIDSFQDHRIAMAFAIAGLLAKGETQIQEAECVDISFPNYFDLLERLKV